MNRPEILHLPWFKRWMFRRLAPYLPIRRIPFNLQIWGKEKQ